MMISVKDVIVRDKKKKEKLGLVYCAWLELQVDRLR